MSLAEYRVADNVDVSLVDPFASRLLRLLELFGGRVLIVSGRRSLAEQQALYDAYLAGGALAAKPGTSRHESGQAADLRIVDPSVQWREVHMAASTYGLVFPLLALHEPWHCEADPAWIEPEDDDMTPQQLAHALGGTLDGFGRVVIPLADGQLYPIGNILGFLHQEITKDELLPERIKRVIGS